MQEQSHYDEEQHAIRQVSEIESHSFQKGVYPSRSEINRWYQYFIGLGIGITELAIFLAAFILFAAYNTSLDAMNLLSLMIIIAALIAFIVAVIVSICIPRIRFMSYGWLTIALILLTLCSYYHLWGL